MSEMRFIKGKCVGLSFEGRGIVKVIDEPIFVDGLLPNEEADIEINYKRAGYKYGRVKRLYNLSEHRIKPRCGVSTACGGCQFQNYAYSQQLVFKKEQVEKAFLHEFKEEFKVEDVIGMDDPYHYRNKIIKPVGLDNHGHIISGFYRNKTHQIINNENCVIESEIAAKVTYFVINAMKKYQIRPYDEKSKKGEIRYIFIRHGDVTNETCLVLVTYKKSFKNKDEFFKEIINSGLNLTSFIQNVNDKDTNVVLGDKSILVSGRPFIYDEISGIKFKITPESFYQVNHTQTEKLYGKALELANLSKEDIVIDAYSGIGTISLLASKKAKSVIGVEIVKEAYLDAIENSKLNCIDNVKFVNDDATKFIVEYVKNNRADVLFMDPPRKGSTEEFLDSILSIKIPKIVYVSCNPFTLARDLKYLSNDYDIKTIVPVDMFPFTHHVETVVLIEIKKS